MEYLDGAGAREQINKSSESLAEAEEVLTGYFSEYDPESTNADIVFSSLVAQLDLLFYPDSSGETASSLDQEIIRILTEPQAGQDVSTLDKLAVKYPRAVQRFKHLYCQEPSEPWSPERAAIIAAAPPDPYRHIFKEDRDAVISRYGSPECPAGESVEFILKAIHGGVNHDEGIAIAGQFIEQRGWDAFLEVASELHRADEQADSLFGSIVEVVHILSSPKELPIETIEKLFEYAQNDLEWVVLDSYLDARKKTEQLELVSKAEQRELLRDYDVPFWDERKTSELALDLMRVYPEARYRLVQELQQYGYDISPYDDPHSFIYDIPSVFLFNCITQYTPDDYEEYSPDGLYKSGKGALVRSVMLSDEELKSRAGALVVDNPDAFVRAQFMTEFAEKAQHAAVLASSTYDFLSYTESAAAREGRKGVDRWGYLINSSALPVAKDTVAVYSPTGRLLDIVKAPAKEAGAETDQVQSLADYLNMSHILSDERQFSRAENATAIMLIFWDRLPEEWQEQIQETFLLYDVDVLAWVAESPNSFESAVSFASDLVPIVQTMEGFPEALQQFVEDSYQTVRGELEYPEPIDDNELQVLMSTEYSGTNVTEEEVHDTVRQLSFAGVRYLQDTFQIDFSALKRREFFGLLQYLRLSSGGQGFANLKQLAAAFEGDAEAVANSIRSFMSLERGNVSLGDAIVAFGAHHEQAGEVFASYGALLDEVEEIEQLIHAEVDCAAVDCAQLVVVARERLLKDTQAYLVNAVQSGVDDGVAAGLSERKVGAKALAAAMTSYLAGGGASVEQLRSFEKQTQAGRELSPEMVAELARIYEENYRALGYDEESISGLVDGLQQHVAEETTQVRSWNFGDDQVLAFAVTTENESTESVYVSGLNVNADLKTTQAARSLLEEIVTEYGEKGWVIQAEASPRNFQGYGEMGWVATGVKEDDLGQETHLFDIAVLPRQTFVSKDMSRKELRARYEAKGATVGEDGVLVWSSEDSLAVPPQLQQGFVITRMFPVKGRQGQADRYVYALERPDARLSDPTVNQM